MVSEASLNRTSQRWMAGDRLYLCSVTHSASFGFVPLSVLHVTFIISVAH